MALQVLIHPREGEDRYDRATLVHDMSRAEQDDVPEQHVLSGPLTSAFGIERVICLSVDPVDETSDENSIRLSVLFEEIDPRVALRAASATAAQAAAADTAAEEEAAAQEAAIGPTSAEGDYYDELLDGWEGQF